MRYSIERNEARDTMLKMKEGDFGEIIYGETKQLIYRNRYGWVSLNDPTIAWDIDDQPTLWVTLIKNNKITLSV